MSLKKSVLSGIKWASIGSITLALIGVIKISILARFLDKEDFGLMALATLVMGFMDLFNDMGLTSAILHKQNITKKEYGSLYWFNLLISLIMYGMLLLVTPFVSAFYDVKELNVIIPLLGLNLLLSGVGRMFKTIDQKNLLFKRITIIDVSAAFLSLGLAIFLAFNNYGVYTLVYSVLFQYIVTNIVYLFFGWKDHGLLFHFRYIETKPFLKIGIFQVGGQVVNYFSRDLDILIIGKVFSPSLLGGYSLAKQLVMRPMQILNPIISRVASPTLAKFQDDLNKLKINFLRLVNIYSTFSIPAYILLIVFAPLIVNILYGSDFNDIVILVRILGIYMLIRSINNPISSLVIATGRTDLDFYWNIVKLLITPICIYIGVSFGLLGAAIGITLSSIILFVPAWKFLVNRMTGAKFSEYLRAVLFLKWSLLKGKLS